LAVDLGSTGGTLSGLPQKVQDIIVGGLLGDAHASKYGKNLGNTRIEFKQGVTHAPYLFFIYFQLLFWGFVTAYTPLPKSTSDGKGGTHQFLRFRTKRLPVFNWFRDLFYPAGIKIVPAIIALLLTPRAFAYWIMDDGGYRAKGMILHTNSFTKADVMLLISVLDSNFGIKATIRAAGKKWVIYVPVAYMPTVQSVVLPYMHSSMLYKIHA
jgi:hypothetical protein